MCLNLNIPEDAERTLRDAWGAGLERATLEALVIESYRSGKFGIAEVRRVLGLPSRWDAERWLGERAVLMNYAEDDLEEDRRNLDDLFGKKA